MKTWQIILLVICILIYWGNIRSRYEDYKYVKDRGRILHYTWRDYLELVFLPLVIIYNIIELFYNILFDYISEVRKHGGIQGYRDFKRQQKIEEEQSKKAWLAQKEEDERIRKAYLNGDIKKEDLPRAENGTDSFEFEVEMGLFSDSWRSPQEIVYIENEYCPSLNDFFIRNKDLRLYNMYRFEYLPRLNEELRDGYLLHYLQPELTEVEQVNIEMDSTYPLKYLWRPEDVSYIKHGMMFFVGNKDNHGEKYICGYYYPLEEGSDDYIIEQLHSIVKRVHVDHGEGGCLCMKVKKPEIEEGSSEDYADELFSWVNYDPEVAIIVKEIREKVETLRERGMAEKLIRKIIQIEPKLSRLVVTKDMRILLPDYNNMEIVMEPINKAVFLLFLKHPEGIIFKCLPDYRKELAEIYQMIKPLGLNDRAIQSIEDATNPCLNSINEKCARIRGAFISQFDENLAQHYFIRGYRGEAKKISLPRDLVVWE